MTDEDTPDFAALAWMPSRIPIRDSLVASVANAAQIPEEKIPSSYEQRWYPEPDGSLRLLVPYDGGDFDESIFHIERRAWDHTTCDWCTTRIAPMALCFVTTSGRYIGLCRDCYRKQVVSRKNILAQVVWYLKRWVGVHAAG
jgi:hypothetical protein